MTPPINLGILAAAGGGSLPASYWVSALTTSNNDSEGNAIVSDSSGNVYVAGLSDSFGPGTNAATVTKFDIDGNILWQKFIGGSSENYATAIVLDSDENPYVAASVRDGHSGSQSWFFGKLDQSGSLIFQKTLDGFSFDEPDAMAVDSSNNFYIVGRDNSTASDEQTTLFKLDSSGNELFSTNLYQSNSDTVRSQDIVVADSGNIYVCGRLVNAGRQNGFVSKFNSSGQLQFTRKTTLSTGQMRSRAVALDSNENIYVANQYDGDSLQVSKYNSSGSLQRQNLINFANPYAIEIDDSDNIYVAGYTQQAGLSGDGNFIIKMDNQLTVQYQRVLATNGIEEMFYAGGLFVDVFGNMYQTGGTRGIGNSDFDILNVKVPTDGSLTGTYQLDGNPVEWSAMFLSISSPAHSDSAFTLVTRSTAMTVSTSSLSTGNTSFTYYLDPIP